MAGNQRVRQTGTREPITRKREGETLKGCSYRVVQPDWHIVTKKQRTEAQGEQIRVNRISNETESGRDIFIVTLNIRSGKAGGRR